MVTNLKALLVVMVMALAVFHFSKPICLSFMDEADFKLRRNVWVFLTAVAFISPNFWIFIIVASLAYAWAGRKDKNPIALYVLMLHIIPPVSVDLPSVIVNSLFEINNYRVLTLTILVPVAWRLFSAKKKIDFENKKAVDRFMLAFIALQLFALMPYEDITNTVRRGFLMLLDSYVLLYVICRTCIDRKKIVEVLSVYCLASAILVPIAVFESVKLWLPYTELTNIWDIPNRGAYLFRDGSLRAQASTGHSLALGYILAMAFGVWLFLATYVKSPKVRVIGYLGVWAGLISALSRAPWLTAVLVFFVYIILNKQGFSKLRKVVLVSLPIIGIALVSPLAPKIIDKLPFVGTVDSFNVNYREQLAASSWELIKRNPFLGDPMFMDHLENMRQGEGIIDLVNVYASIAMPYGGIGLFLFMGPFIWAFRSAWKLSRKTLLIDTELSLLGAVIIACMIGTAFFMATGSFYGALPQFYYLVIGLAICYGQLKYAESDKTAGTNKYK